MDSSTSTAVTKLPDEVLLQIFQYFPPHVIISDIMHVCERWREVVVNYIPWKNAKANGMLRMDWSEAYFGDDDFECSVKVLRKAATAGVKIESLHLKNCGQNLNSGYSHIRNCETLADSALEIICSNNLELQNLVFECVTINEKIGLFDVLDKCPLLKSLKLDRLTCIYTAKSENYDNSKLLNYVNVTDLNLSCDSDSDDINNEWILQLIRRCSSLRNFETKYLKVTSQFVEALSELKQLESINFNSVVAKDKEILRSLENNSTVKVFKLSPHFLTKCEAVDLHPISTMTGLKQVKMHLWDVSTSEMAEFLASLPLSIENFSLQAGRIEMNDEHLLLLSERLGPHLKSVKINIIDQDFTDSGLRVFINKMKELEYLKLNFEIDGEESMLSEGNTWITAIVNHPTLKRVLMDIKDEDIALSNNYFNLIENSPLVWGSVYTDCEEESADYRHTLVEINWRRDFE